MKLISMLAVASLLSSAAAFAADAPAAPPAAAPTSTAAASKHHSTKYCRKEAKSQGLKGDAAKDFIKKCKAGE